MLPPSPHENVVGNPLVVCTAHIHWDPEFCDVKLVQTMMLVHELAKVVDDVGRTFRIDPQHVSTLLCGDLNSLPDSGMFIWFCLCAFYLVVGIELSLLRRLFYWRQFRWRKLWFHCSNE